MSNENSVEMKDISKSFFGVPVLKNVSFSLKKGEIRAFVGENGAGKSTLMKILSGIYQMDSGEILLNGEHVDIANPSVALSNKICIIHQEISLAPNLNIADNIFLGSEVKKGLFEDRKAMTDRAQKAINTLGLNIPVKIRVSKLSVAQQQMVEIARALVFDSNIIILDEPTAALSDNEAENLFKLLKGLKEKGISIIYISHRLEEIFLVADSVTVMRDGQMIGTKGIKETNQNDVISMMVGRNITDFFGTNHPVGGKPILEVKGLKNKYLKKVSFDLREGEILGFAGLVGAGRTELARAIYGIDKLESGEIWMSGERIFNKNPNLAMKNGIGLISEDRKKTGLFLAQSISYNITLMVLKQFIRFIFIDRKKEKSIIDTYANKLSIKMTSPKQHCIKLSGGNQQKVVISKLLALKPKVLIMDEPTRGVDVGAKAEIYHLINDLAGEGYAIMMISSELPEIINMSSRIAVMCEGELMKIIDTKDKTVSQEEIMHYAIGGR